jgi:DNA-3-methyladenine glycosylase
VGPLHVAEDGEGERGEVAVSTRIGLTKAADRLLRFHVRGSRFVSGPVRP